MSGRAEKAPGVIKRHTVVELIEHWTVAISGLILVVTGVFELPIAARYYITELPGLTWSGDFIAALEVHYAASVVFVAASLFHVVYHGLHGHTGLLPEKGDMKASVEVIRAFFGKTEEPPFHKYLPEQRIAYAGMVFIIAGLIISGLIKTFKNVYAPDMSLVLVAWATWVHNAFFVLFVLAFALHMAAIAIKPNRPLVRSIFTGYVRLDYARSRHPLWLDDLEPPETDVMQEEPAAFLNKGESHAFPDDGPVQIADRDAADIGYDAGDDPAARLEQGPDPMDAEDHDGKG